MLNEKEAYKTRVDDHFKSGIFPHMRDLFGRDIILKCWNNQYGDADAILEDAVRLS